MPKTMRNTRVRDADHGVFGAGREIGPIGTASRIAGGLVAIALPIALAGFGWWDAAVALVALPLVAIAGAALVTSTYERLDPEARARRQAICSGPACWLIAIMVAASAAFGVLTPASGDVTLWVWLGASMLIAAVQGYGGCEVLAVPNLITGRRDRIGCLLFTPIDRAEARLARSRQRQLGDRPQPGES